MSALRLADPAAIVALAVVPALAALFLYGDRRRRAALAQFSAAPVKHSISPAKRAFKRALMIAAAALVAVALARPSRQSAAVPPPESGDVVFLLDVSRSMFSHDASPSRLGRAREIAAGIAQQAAARWPGERVSLIAFAGGVAVLCPLTVDGAYFRETLDSASGDSVGFGGSRIGDALHFALRYGFDDIRRGAKDVILLTDGGDQGGPSTVAQELPNSGIRLTVIGVGDPLRETPVPVSETDSAPFLYRGVPVRTRLDSPELRAFGGAYIEDGPLFRPAEVVDRVAARAAATPAFTDEIYPFLLALAIVLLAIEAAISDRAVRRAALAASIFALSLSAQNAVSWVKEGADAFAYKEYEHASTCYANAADLEPASPSIRFDLGIARYRARDYAAAENAFQAASLHASDAKLRSNSLLGAGNAEYRMALADPSAPNIAELELAVASYEEALKADPKSADANHNLEIAKQKLEELQRRRRAKAEQDLARASMRKPQAAPASAQEILENAKKKNAKASPYRRVVDTDW
jgi:tetratricopeptide (TPR) repeat protein